MATTSTQWLKGCGIGCGVALLVVVLAAVGGSYALMTPFRDAVAIRETLDERHGGVDDFTPWPDGGIPAERLDAFLAVRRAVQESCAALGASASGLEALERLDDREEPDAREVLGAFGESSKSLFSMGATMGGLFRARNAALLDVDMGLGEYTCLYAAAYGPTLVRAVEPGAGARAPLSRRVRETLRQQLRNRLAAMDAGPGEWAGTAERDLLAAEIALLEQDLARLPWQDGRPPALAASLAPYEERLAALFCPGASHLELTRNRTFGLGIKGD